MNIYKEKEKERNVNNIFFDPHQTFQTMTHTTQSKTWPMLHTQPRNPPHIHTQATNITRVI